MLTSAEPRETGLAVKLEVARKPVNNAKKIMSPDPLWLG
jgi:hypothetical protein